MCSQSFQLTSQPTHLFIIHFISPHIIIGTMGSHINILNNHGEIDCRISVKREIEVDQPPAGSIPFNTREKIRSSYQVGIFSIDLTELPIVNRSTGEKTTAFEVEIEILSSYVPMLRQSLHDYTTSRTTNSNFVKIVRSLVLTIQTLLTLCDPRAPLPALCKVKPLGEHQLKKMRPFDISQSSAVVSLNQGGLAGESRM